MVVFLDTSAWIKIFLEEEGSLEAQNFLNQAFHHDNVNLLTAPIT